MKGLVKEESPREEPQLHIDCTGDLQVIANSSGFGSCIMCRKSASLFGVFFTIFHKLN